MNSNEDAESQQRQQSDQKKAEDAIEGFKIGEAEGNMIQNTNLLAAPTSNIRKKE